MKNKYFSLVTENKAADLTIFGDITSWPWLESDVSSHILSKQLAELTDVDEIIVHLNSCGGEVAEGLAIYNSLKNHPAKVTTICDGFACSIASVIFLAGDERVMNESSLLMIHNAWQYVSGNAEDLRKAADDLDTVTQASVNAYKSHSNLSEEEIKELMDNETWILPEQAVEYGFATAILGEDPEEKSISQSSMGKITDIVRAYQEKKNEQIEGKPKDPKDPKEPEDPKDPKNPIEPKDENDCSIEQFFNAILSM